MATATYRLEADKLTFVTAAAPEPPDIDTSAGPANVGPEDLSGRVIDATRNPVAGAEVSFVGVYPPREPSHTDANGAFRFPTMARTRYWYLRIEKSGLPTRFLFDLPIGKPFTVRMDSATRFKGTLLLPDGSPAAKSTITLEREKVGTGYGSLVQIDYQTDERGAYDLPVEPGDYEARLSAPGGYYARQNGLRITSGQVQSFPRQLEPGLPLRLIVIDSMTRKPVAGARAWVCRRSSLDRRFQMEPGTERTTDEERPWSNGSRSCPAGTSCKLLRRIRPHLVASRRGVQTAPGHFA